MNLTPKEIEEKQFHDVFRGYSHEEVDEFLDEITQTFQEVYKENQDLHHRVLQLEASLNQVRGTEEALKQMLLAAQKTADEAVKEGHIKGQGVITASETEAQQIIANAERRAREITGSAQSLERQITERIDGLKRFEVEHKARIRAFLETQMKTLEEGPVRTPAQGSSFAPAAADTTKQPTQKAVEPPAAISTDRKQEVASPSHPTDFQSAVAEPRVEQRPSAPVQAERQRVGAEAGQAGPVSVVPTSPQPSMVTKAETGKALDEEERTIKELFWGDE